MNQIIFTIFRLIRTRIRNIFLRVWEARPAINGTEAMEAWNLFRSLAQEQSPGWQKICTKIKTTRNEKPKKIHQESSFSVKSRIKWRSQYFQNKHQEIKIFREQMGIEQTQWRGWINEIVYICIATRVE